ncbi:hypothetical protein ACMHYT_03720 [Rhodococcus qingshengii]|uniref:hypothetical protein n=1 Tax=Rhodococcus qingshengii TaxID=334542 RepID=UPI0039C3C8F1
MMENSEMVKFIAAKWQREQASHLAEWRASERGLANRQLSTLCEAISDTVFSQSNDVHELADKLESTLSRCDQLQFDSFEEAGAYTLLHLADRYGRVGQVLERLFVSGHLPIRLTRLSVLDVGAGPAPGLYAVNDFYDELAQWASETRQVPKFTTATNLHAIDRGKAWPRLLHHLSETLILKRRDLPSNSRTLPFNTAYSDFTGFSTRKKHIEAREINARSIQDEYDVDEAPTIEVARQLGQQDALTAPSAYDLIFVSNFLTMTEMTHQFQEEIRDLAKGLTPGGLLIALGATGKHYPAIWNRVQSIVASTGLVPVPNFHEPIAANEDSDRAHIIHQHERDFLTLIRESGGQLPSSLEKAIDNPMFPKFQAMVWKNRRSN